jgi:hypothetical protein
MNMLHTCDKVLVSHAKYITQENGMTVDWRLVLRDLPKWHSHSLSLSLSLPRSGTWSEADA